MKNMHDYFKFRKDAEDRVAELNEDFNCFASCYRGHRHWVVVWKEKVEQPHD